MARASRLCAVALAAGGLLSSGCSDLFLVEVEAGSFQLERVWDLAPVPIETCPFGTFALPAGPEPVKIDAAPLEGGCMFDFQVSDLTLLREEAVAKRAEEIEEQGDIDSLQGLDLVVDELEITDRSGAPFDLDAVDSIAIGIDGQTVLRRPDIDLIRAGESVRFTLSQAFVERFIDVLEKRRELNVDLSIRLVARLSERPLPPTLRVRAELRPVLLVDVVAAKF